MFQCLSLRGKIKSEKKGKEDARRRRQETESTVTGRENKESEENINHQVVQRGKEHRNERKNAECPLFKRLRD